MENDDRLMTLAEVGQRMRLKGQPHNQVRKVRKLIRAGIMVPVVQVSPHETLIRAGVVDQVIRAMEGEGYGPTNRIARVRPRQRA